jgi:hypothetical protein
MQVVLRPDFGEVDGHKSIRLTDHMICSEFAENKENPCDSRIGSPEPIAQPGGSPAPVRPAARLPPSWQARSAGGIQRVSREALGRCGGTYGGAGKRIGERKHRLAVRDLVVVQFTDFEWTARVEARIPGLGLRIATLR